MPRNLSTSLRQWPLWLTLALALALAPALRHEHLPLNFDWARLSISYWLVLAPQAIFAAVLLALIGMPRSTTLDPLLARYRHNLPRLALTILYFALLAWSLTTLKAVILTVDTIAILELRERLGNRSLIRALTEILPPAIYLFFGFLLVFAYNSVIASARYNPSSEFALASIDRSILFGHSVASISHWAAQAFPLFFFRALEWIYFGMFPQIGAAVILTALYHGRARSFQFVSALLVCYFLALALFFLWPSQGPYALCSDHLSCLPTSLQTSRIQSTLTAHALARSRHEPLVRLSTDYYIGLPCMHVAQPLIVLWFLPWRRMRIALAAYDILLVIAIVLLQWHYIIDILAGALVAILAIALTHNSRTQPEPLR